MKNRPLLCVCLFIAAAVILAATAGGERMIRELRASPLERYAKEGQRLCGTGEVYRTEQKARTQAVYLKNVSLRCGEASFFEKHLLIYTDPHIQLKIGNTAEILGEAAFFSHARNPGNFDQKRYYQIRDIHGMIWAESVTVTDSKVRRAAQSLSDFRQAWNGILVEELGEEQGSALAAMMLGEKSGMDPELKALYQANGIGHILAISGLHLSLIGLGTYGVVRRLTGSYLAGGTVGILFLVAYVMMIGMTVSVARALIMFLFRTGADMTGRKYDSATALAAAGAVILVLRPLSVYDGGFWMSFGAAAAMTAVLPLFRKLPLQGFWGSVSVNLVLLPVILRCFFEIPVYSIFLNLYVIPLMSALLFLGMAGSAVCFVLPGLGAVILHMAGVILTVYETSCEWALRLPAARWIPGMPQWYGVVLYYLLLGIILIMEFGRRKKSKEEKLRNRRKLLYIGIWLMGLWGMCCRFGENGSLKIAVLDVGQGDCIFIRGPDGKNYLVDGGSSDVNQVGRYRIEPFLKSQGAGQIDYVLVSHGDEDHINGIRELIERRAFGIQVKKMVMPVRQVWDESLAALAEEARRAGIGVYEIAPGDALTEEGLCIRCLAPSDQEKLEPGNEASMVLAVRYGEFDMLLTGDVEGTGEICLTESLQQEDRVSWDVLKAAHHGSKSSSSPELIAAIRPVYTVISAGMDNPYGHPHQEVLERLRAAGSQILSTQNLGAVLFQIRDNRMFLRRMAGEG